MIAGKRIPNFSDNEDEEMEEAPPEDPPTPQEDEEQNEQGEDEDEQNDAEDDATPSQASPRPSRSATPRRGGRTAGLLRGRRRQGRPRKSQPAGSEEEGNEAASDAGTPKRRGGFRGRSRWMKNKAGQSRQQPPPVDDEGNTMEIVNDEVLLPGNPVGDKKVDENGRLQGGREYRVRTFTIMGRDQRLYMLSTEPARCIGFRDSYLLFQKHKYLYKILLDEEEKLDLVSRDIIPHSYKGRSIGVVTARSIYREFGAVIIVAGKKVTDDYDEQKAREDGAVEGELAAPDDRVPQYGQSYNRNQYVAWHGASAVYHTNLPNVPLQGGKVEAKRRRERVAITSENWMLEHAMEASRFNSTLSKVRNQNFNGIYDIHTNSMHWPEHLQSTHARWEKVGSQPQNGDMVKASSLPMLDPVYGRNFRIHDFCLESAPDSTLGQPGYDNDENSLSRIPPDVLEELPENCLEALRSAQDREITWKDKWTTEKADGLRAYFLPSVEWYPK